DRARTVVRRDAAAVRTTPGATAASAASPAAGASSAGAASAALVVLGGFGCCRCLTATALLLGATTALLFLLALALALLVGRDGGRGLILECGQLGLEGDEVVLLLVQRGLRGFGRLLRLDHLLFGDLLQPVALVARRGRLIRQSLRRVARRCGLVGDGAVVLEELVHAAQAREQVVGAVGGVGEEELESGLVAAVPV